MSSIHPASAESSSVITLLRGWKIIATLLVLGVVAGLGFSALVPTRYQGQVTFFVSNPTSAKASRFESAQLAQERVASYVQLLGSDRLASMIVQDAKLTVEPTSLAKRISGQSDANTVLFTANILDENQDQALSLASQIATQMIKLTNELEAGSDPAQSQVALQVVSGPRVTDGPIQPVRRNYAIIGAAFGLLLGCAFVLLADMVRAAGGLGGPRPDARKRVRGEDVASTRSTGRLDPGAAFQVSRRDRRRSVGVGVTASSTSNE